jgi:signal transduction histidine kinase
MLDRFIDYDPKGATDGKNDFNENAQLDGVYVFTIENSKIVNASNKAYSEEIQKYAISLGNGRFESGIIGDYIYKVKMAKGSKTVILMENKTVVSQIKMILIFSAIGCVVALIAIYALAKKISKMIVRPIQETFEKQKQFISDASHELKTPLAVIEANTDVLENEIGNNKWLKYIQNEIESMDKLINELLLLTKVENTNEVKEYVDFDMSKEAEIVVSMFESMAYEKNVVLKCNIQEGIIIKRQ